MLETEEQFKKGNAARSKVSCPKLVYFDMLKLNLFTGKLRQIS